MTRNTQARHARRKGYGLLEVAVAVFLLMVAMSVTVRVVGWMGRERRTAERRSLALQEASNVLEHVTTLPFDRVNTDLVNELTAKSQATALLPDPQWETEVTDSAGDAPRSRRVTLKLRWKADNGEPGPPVRLSAWVFPQRRPS